MKVADIIIFVTVELATPVTLYAVKHLFVNIVSKPLFAELSFFVNY